jgi:DNA-binding GntR family transcriptional regulator
MTQTKIVDKIVAGVLEAVTDGRLAPGAKLAEQRLGQVYGVSRTIARQALQQLAMQKVVTLEPARGAFVSIPSPSEAAQVFAVRRMLEVESIREFASAHVPASVRSLKAHVKKEQAAIKENDVPLRTQLLAEFHILIAQLSGNAVLAELLHDLTRRCALIALVYQTSIEAEHSSQEHEEILAAIQARDANLAASLMDAHLRHVEHGLRAQTRPSSGLALALQTL